MCILSVRTATLLNVITSTRRPLGCDCISNTTLRWWHSASILASVDCCSCCCCHAQPVAIRHSANSIRRQPSISGMAPAHSGCGRLGAISSHGDMVWSHRQLFTPPTRWPLYHNRMSALRSASRSDLLSHPSVVSLLHLSLFSLSLVLLFLVIIFLSLLVLVFLVNFSCFVVSCMFFLLCFFWHFFSESSDVNRDWRLNGEDRTKDLQTLWFINVPGKLYSISIDAQKCDGVIKSAFSHITYCQQNLACQFTINTGIMNMDSND